MKIWAVELLETPKPAQRTRDFRIKLCGIRGAGIDHKTAARGVRLRRKILWASTLALDMEHEIVRNTRRENQGSALDRQDQRRLLQAVQLFGIDRAQRRQLRAFHRGQ